MKRQVLILATLAGVVACNVDNSPDAEIKSGEQSEVVDCSNVATKVKEAHQEKKNSIDAPWAELEKQVGSAAAGEEELAGVEDNVNGNDVMTMVKPHVKKKILGKKAKLKEQAQKKLELLMRKERLAKYKERMLSKLVDASTKWLKDELDDAAKDDSDNDSFAKYLKRKHMVTETAKQTAADALSKYSDELTAEDIKQGESVGSVKTRYKQSFTGNDGFTKKIAASLAKEVSSKLAAYKEKQKIKKISGTSKKLTHAQLDSKKARYFELKEIVKTSEDSVRHIYEAIETEVGNDGVSSETVKEAVLAARERLKYLAMKKRLYKDDASGTEKAKQAMLAFKAKLENDKRHSSNDNDADYNDMIDIIQRKIDSLMSKKSIAERKADRYQASIDALYDELDSLLSSNSKKTIYINKLKEYIQNKILFYKKLHEMEEIIEEFADHYDDSDSSEEYRQKLADCQG